MKFGNSFTEARPSGDRSNDHGAADFSIDRDISELPLAMVSISVDHIVRMLLPRALLPKPHSHKDFVGVLGTIPYNSQITH